MLRAILREVSATSGCTFSDATSRRHGVLVKSTGDGIDAAFDDALDAVVSRLEFVINLKQAKALGITIPRVVGLQADYIYE
jgi:hypothetical protein